MKEICIGTCMYNLYIHTVCDLVGTNIKHQVSALQPYSPQNPKTLISHKVPTESLRDHSSYLIIIIEMGLMK